MGRAIAITRTDISARELRFIAKRTRDCRVVRRILIADKMKEHKDDNLGFGIFEKVDKDLGLSRGTAWDASKWKDYCDFGFGDV